jgi:hypothetical protein
VPKIASDVGIFRETMTQPGVYWLLQAPFVNIIGLYSNIAEGPGNLTGAKGDKKTAHMAASHAHQSQKSEKRR